MSSRVIERAFTAASIIVLIIIWLWPAFRWSELPERVPIHFGFSGEVNGWGPRGMIFSIPVGALFIFLTTQIPRFRPNIMNLPEGSPETLEARRQGALTFLAVLIFEV